MRETKGGILINMMYIYMHDIITYFLLKNEEEIKIRKVKKIKRKKETLYLKERHFDLLEKTFQRDSIEYKLN